MIIAVFGKPTVVIVGIHHQRQTDLARIGSTLYDLCVELRGDVYGRCDTCEDGDDADDDEQLDERERRPGICLFHVWDLSAVVSVLAADADCVRRHTQNPVCVLPMRYRQIRFSVFAWQTVLPISFGRFVSMNDRISNSLPVCRRPAFLFLLSCAAMLSSFTFALSPERSVAEEDLPVRTPGERFDFEPDLMLDDVLQKPVPDEPSPVDQVAKLVTEIERATRSAATGERLFRSGVIAKVEAEQRALKVIRLKSNLAQARLLVAQAEVEQVRANGAATEHSAEQIERAEAALAAARISADAAAQAWQRAELTAAELDLDRQRKLVAAGIGSKARVQRAMDRVSQLKAKEEAARPASAP